LIAEPEPSTAPGPRRKRVRALSAGTYLVRNAGRTLPLTGVILLAVVLITGIVAMMNSIPLSIRTTYSYSKYLLGISPRGDESLTPKMLKTLKKDSPVPIERIVTFRASASQVRSVVGKWPFLVLGLSQGDTEYFVHKLGTTNIVGRLPAKGKPEAIISEPVARNLQLKIGSVLLSPIDQDNYSPHYVKVVGIAMTKEWLMVDSLDYQKENHFPPVDNIMVFARNLQDQNTLDHWAVKTFKGDRAIVFAYYVLEKQTDENFKTLYAILDVVIGVLVLVITIMMGMLINIYQSQRLVEFGLLQAIGYTKKQLLKRVLRETTWVLLLGWTVGLASAYGLLEIVNKVLMYPHAYALDTLDPIAIRYTIPVPISILLVATLTVWLRFRKFDPVGVVERRLV
jgi:ABC-type lipoprotein release transport system permease subunit